MHSRESIQALLARNDNAVYRALEVLLERQTADEQQAGVTNHLNGMGFNATDAKFGTDLANKVIAWNRGESTFPYPLSVKQLASARKMLRKYAQQLANVANEKTAVAV